MKEINLFQIGREISERKTKLIRGARIVVVLFLIFYCLLAGGIFSYWLILKKQRETTADKIKLQEQRINEIEEVETLHIFIKQRLSSLSSFFIKEKLDYSKVLTRLEALIPKEVALTGINFSQEGNLEFSGTAPNAVVFADFLDRLLVSERDEFIKNVDLSSVSRQEDGSYNFNLKLDVES